MPWIYDFYWAVGIESAVLLGEGFTELGWIKCFWAQELFKIKLWVLFIYLLHPVSQFTFALAFFLILLCNEKIDVWKFSTSVCKTHLMVVLFASFLPSCVRPVHTWSWGKHWSTVPSLLLPPGLLSGTLLLVVSPEWFFSLQPTIGKGKHHTSGRMLCFFVFIEDNLAVYVVDC